MRIVVIILAVLINSSVYAQEKEEDYSRISYSEFYKMLTDESDTILMLEKVLVEFDPETDSALLPLSNGVEELDFIRKDTLRVTKELQFNKVITSYAPRRGTARGVIPMHYLTFERPVVLKNSGIHFQGCTFKDRVTISFLDESMSPYSRFESVIILHSELLGGTSYRYDAPSNKFNQSGIWFSEIIANEMMFFNVDSQYNFWLTANRFSGDGFVLISLTNVETADIDRNVFLPNVLLSINDVQNLNVNSNQFEKTPRIDISSVNPSGTIGYDEFSDGFVSNAAYDLHFYWLTTFDSLDGFSPEEPTFFPSDKNMEYYMNRATVEDRTVYKEEMKLRGQLRNLYLDQADSEFANAVFMDMKDMETRRLAFLYDQNPSFDTYFQWKVNQFLKIFSDYGTRPSKAIVFAIYVIAFFALIYLFFPNSWDAHGRTRIMDRYRFFLKYLNRNEGASEVYRDEKEKELMPFHEFRDYLEQQGKTAPRFFYATALPLYKWSVSGSRFSGWFLSKIDVLNGKWSEVPEKGKFLKSALVIGAFLFAFLYDLLIKVLNAVMLSINTFTTLGFGEIPIKGLPRYLAIIQGFIGWFMLTIFSVSLISQLLN